MNKLIVLTIIALFLIVAVAPSINAEINDNSISNDENLFCTIKGKITSVESFRRFPLLDRYIRQPRTIGPRINTHITFGYDWTDDINWGEDPSKGYLSSRGMNGIITWEGNRLFGNIEPIYLFSSFMGSQLYESYYIGIKHFTGLLIPTIWRQDSELVFGHIIIGRGMRVSLTEDLI